MGGISNFQIEKAFKKIDDEDLLDNFVGVFPSNYMNKLINHAAMIEDSGKYPFIIANTDSADTPGEHWWNILDIEPRTDIFFFDSYGIEGLKHFIIQDDRPIVDQILIGIEKMDRTDNKITLCKVKFNLSACKNLTENEINSLSETARNFFYFIQAFGIKPKLRGFVNIWMVEFVQPGRKQQNSRKCKTKQKNCWDIIKRDIFSWRQRKWNKTGGICKQSRN